MDALPVELVLQIFSRLDVPPPSILNFAHEPTKDLPSAPSNLTPLKALSLTSRRYHALLPVDEDTLNAMQPALKTLSAHERDIYTRMRKKIAKGFQWGIDSGEIAEMVEFIWIRNEDHWFAQSSSAVWGPPPLIDKVESLVIVASREYDTRYKIFRNAEAALHHAVVDLWTRVFDALDPERVVVVAPPATMIELTELIIPSNGTWVFERNFHYLELRQDWPTNGGRGKKPRVQVEHAAECARAWDGYRSLIHAHPWTHIAYNEDSWVLAYLPRDRTNGVVCWQWGCLETFCLLLERLNREAQVCCSLRSVAFIAVFPWASHVTTTLHPLEQHPTPERLTTQLAPGPENGVLDDEEKLGADAPLCFWHEWRKCHRHVAWFLFRRQWSTQRGRAGFQGADIEGSQGGRVDNGRVEGGGKWEVEEG
ncbi:uncharacterized protein BDZ99DRAFT_573978 [Mytilinidion resinicola]|uniref:F-box domain-containing protein n=1 Tax=Mytilinidion resinicola TaxID=574789 RepID=A0A6A6YD26_9PEZI|nr:uncharacterized protein BDZ99DRAFT_573978 [Mytilinidion resinicola]KAF2806468.1 hypothetical protein BDZ99DRAFT_573978 [Mytilinidion resinicola]